MTDLQERKEFEDKIKQCDLNSLAMSLAKANRLLNSLSYTINVAIYWDNIAKSTAKKLISNLEGNLMRLARITWIILLRTKNEY